MVFCLPLEALAWRGYNDEMKKVGMFLAIVAGLVVLAFTNNYFEKGNEQTKAPKILKIGGVVLNIEFADTEIARTQGLSGKIAKEGDPLGLGLGENEGMLFIFEKPGYYGFWMKDMNFPIDIAWLDKNKKIIYIENNISPNTYPKIFNSPTLSLYVLETPAGFLVENNVKIGDQVAF